MHKDSFHKYKKSVASNDFTLKAEIPCFMKWELENLFEIKLS